MLTDYMKNAFISFGLFALLVLLLCTIMSYCCLTKQHYTGLFFCCVAINCVTMVLGVVMGGAVIYALVHIDKFEVFIRLDTAFALCDATAFVAKTPPLPCVSPLPSRLTHGLCLV